MAEVMTIKEISSEIRAMSRLDGIEVGAGFYTFDHGNGREVYVCAEVVPARYYRNRQKLAWPEGSDFRLLLDTVWSAISDIYSGRIRGEANPGEGDFIKYLGRA